MNKSPKKILERSKSIFKPDQSSFEKETEFKISIKKDEVFLKILNFADFTKCKNDLEAIRVFWDNVWPTFQKVMVDNEVLLSEQAKTLRNYGQLMEDYKLLVIEHDNLRSSIQETGKEEA